MSEVRSSQVDAAGVQQLYDEAVHWHVNTGGERIHAKAVAGKFRNFKYAVWLFWFGYLVLPYLHWNGKQAILFDIPKRQFHLFSATVYPQDIWMLSFVLILLAMMLFGITAVAGRVFCGYFCFQTVWTDWFTRIESLIEGNPMQRRKLDQAPWSGEKLAKRGLKYAIWAVIAVLTGVAFAAYFTDSRQLWHDYLTLQAHPAAWVVLAMFFLGTFYLAGFLREQVCFWLCPYARIQAVMVDKDTVIPTYDLKRGEPRGKLRSGKAQGGEQGDCIDCKVCVAVCPTGVDIREGQQEGCIMCGLCIDACDSVMDKIGKPHGLIRYASQKEIQGVVAPPLLRRPRVIVYVAVFLISVISIVYGLTHIPGVEWHVLHERQPLYIQMSDGTVQNNYTVKILNKTTEPMRVRIEASGVDGLRLAEADQIYTLKPNRIVPFVVHVRAQPEHIPQKEVPISLSMVNLDRPELGESYESFFARPAQ